MNSDDDFRDLLKEMDFYTAIAINPLKVVKIMNSGVRCPANSPANIGCAYNACYLLVNSPSEVILTMSTN